MSDVAPGPGETLDRLAGDWRIYQLAKGHRFSTDDLMTAWTAARAMPDARKLLDLGSGIGSVGLLTLWRLGAEAHLTSVEVQQLSYALARKTIRRNGVSSRVDARLGDLRDPAMVPEQGVFDLVTGSPPYIPIERGVQSPHPQKAAARIELHGSVFDYCVTAARALQPGGRFVFCHAAADPRPEAAVQSAGMMVLSRQGVVFRDDQPPLIALFVCAHASCGEQRLDPPDFVIRNAAGRWTDTYLEMRREMGTVVWNRDQNRDQKPSES